ncbi:MAG: 50S ribosomal protein L15 [Candidatus Omnitrophota bacterium]
MIGLHNLKAPKGAHKRRKILGRGPGSGHGKTSTRGHKGQTSRAGRDFYPGFEGYQNPLIRKIPKRGFTSRQLVRNQIITLSDLDKVKEDSITPEVLRKSGLVKSKDNPIKLLSGGSINRPVKIKAILFSKSAKAKIEQAGGTCSLQ